MTGDNLCFLPERLRPLLHEHAVEVGSRQYALLFVRDLDALLNALPDDAEIPYWSILWDSAIGLSRWIAEHPEIVRGKDVLEIGAGLGLCGMVARELGARVVQTDYHDDALRLMAENARRNGVEPCEQFSADWRFWDHGRDYDVIVGSDVVYELPVQEPLRRIFARNLRPGGVLLLADPCRDSGWEMAQQLEHAGWRVELDTRRVEWEEKRTEILLLRAVRGV